MAHTPLPWVHDETLPGKVYSTDLTGAVIARCAGPGFEFVARSAEEADDNAHIIVRAVNAHDALVAALRDIAGTLEPSCVASASDVWPLVDKMRALARAALAKATAP